MELTIKISSDFAGIVAIAIVIAMVARSYMEVWTGNFFTKRFDDGKGEKDEA